MSKTTLAEVIIVGAGLSGLACAKVLADSHIKTIVLEKNTKEHSKRNSAFLIQKNTYEGIFGNFPNHFENLFEREINEFRAYFLNNSSSMSISNQSNSNRYFSINYSRLTHYLTKLVETKGVEICFENIATELIYRENKFMGVKTEEGEYFSDVVVICDGVNSLLVKNSGLRSGDFTPNQIFIFAEETIDLKEEINGFAAKIFTKDYFKIPSIAYIQTNKDSITMRCGILFSESINSGLNINAFLEKLKLHPDISHLIKGGITRYYTSYILPAHLQIQSKYLMPRLSANGCVVIGGAGSLVNIFSWDLAALPILSGKLAALSIINAKKTGNYSEKNLSGYKKSLEKTKEFKELFQQENLSIFSSKKSKHSLQNLIYNGKDIILQKDVLEMLSSMVLEG